VAPTQTALKKQGPPSARHPTPLDALPPRPGSPCPSPGHLPAPALRGLPLAPPVSFLPPAKLKCKNLLIAEWDEAAPDPARYPYRRSIKPHAFMGRDKFSAGRLHQMRSGKSYLRAHPCWDSDVPTTCPSCQSAPETLEHAIVQCSAKEPARTRHLQGVLDIGPDAPVWSSAALLGALARFVKSTATALPPDMFSRP